ncbi:hypothetical protein M758_8G091900 [Ceratodon purpureus]|nr:hypothetical protein M758_8G091900 [Ceratodon purpureus]
MLSVIRGLQWVSVGICIQCYWCVYDARVEQIRVVHLGSLCWKLEGWHLQRVGATKICAFADMLGGHILLRDHLENSNVIL